MNTADALKSVLMSEWSGLPRAEVALRLARFDYIHGKICIVEFERRVEFALQDRQLLPEYGDCGCCGPRS